MFIILSVVTRMLPIMAKLIAMSKSEYVNTLEFLLLLKESERDSNSAIKDHRFLNSLSESTSVVV